jgi:hypothetical protein
MMSKDYKIVREERSLNSFQRITFKAIDKKGKRIFGASADLDRNKSWKNDRWEEWRLNYGSSGAKNYKDSLPYIEVINMAMKELKNKGK